MDGSILFPSVTSSMGILKTCLLLYIHFVKCNPALHGQFHENDFFLVVAPVQILDPTMYTAKWSCSLPTVIIITVAVYF